MPDANGNMTPQELQAYLARQRGSSVNTAPSPYQTSPTYTVPTTTAPYTTSAAYTSSITAPSPYPVTPQFSSYNMGGGSSSAAPATAEDYGSDNEVAYDPFAERRGRLDTLDAQRQSLKDNKDKKGLKKFDKDHGDLGYRRRKLDADAKKYWKSAGRASNDQSSGSGVDPLDTRAQAPYQPPTFDPSRQPSPERITLAQRTAGTIVDGIDNMGELAKATFMRGPIKNAGEAILRPLAHIPKEFLALVPSMIQMYAASHANDTDKDLSHWTPAQIVALITNIPQTGATLYEALNSIKRGEFWAKSPTHITAAFGEGMNYATLRNENENLAFASMVSHGIAPKAGEIGTELISLGRNAISGLRRNEALPVQADVDAARHAWDPHAASIQMQNLHISSGSEHMMSGGNGGSPQHVPAPPRTPSPVHR